MIEVPLTRGLVALIDDEDAPLILPLRWYSRTTKGKHYALTHTPAGSTSMHQFLMGTMDGKLIDHADGNGLHNFRSNLRFATQLENMANQQAHRDSKNPFKGIWLPKDCRGWAARVFCRGKLHHLGIFPTPELAAQAYDAKARELFGVFAKCNFPAVPR